MNTPKKTTNRLPMAPSHIPLHMKNHPYPPTNPLDPHIPPLLLSSWIPTTKPLTMAPRLGHTWQNHPKKSLQTHPKKTLIHITKAMKHSQHLLNTKPILIY